MITDEDSQNSQEESSQGQGGAGSQESCEWDNYQEDSTYQDSLSYDPLDYTLVEKDTRANSSTDNLLLDGIVLIGHLQSVESQGESSSREDINPGNIIPSDLIENSEDEVFISEHSGNSEVGIMPPKSRTPEQLHDEFVLLFQSWKADANKLMKRKTLPKYVADETEKRYQDLKVIFRDISDADHEWEQNFVNLSGYVEEAYEIRCDLWHKFVPGTWCLDENHRWSTCRQENEDLGCPCGSMISKFICCDTEACISRTNWQQVSSITSNSNSMPIATTSTIVNGVAMGEAMLPIQSIPLSDTDLDVCCMFDNCSQSTFISMRAAQKLNLKGKPISFILVLSDGTKKPMRGLLYKVELRDVHGQTHEFEAIGLARLSTDYPAIKTANVRETIHHLPQIASSSFSDEKISRVGGELDLLIGSDLANLHPKFVANINHLVILRSLFGTGWTFMGHN